MEKEKTIKFQVLGETWLQMQICCNLTPEEMEKRQHEVNSMLPISGTMNGWKIDLERTPVKCADGDGWWHYIAYC